jgi:hypothetical protein
MTPPRELSALVIRSSLIESGRASQATAGAGNIGMKGSNSSVPGDPKYSTPAEEHKMRGFSFMKSRLPVVACAALSMAALAQPVSARNANGSRGHAAGRIQPDYCSAGINRNNIM